MKKNIKYNALLFALTALFIIWGCSSSDDPKPITLPNPPPKLPVTPPSPNLPTTITSVSDITSGQKTGEVFLYGHLTRKKNDDDNEWFFTDGGPDEIVLDFSSTDVPAVNTNILVHGAVEDVGEVDVFRWDEESTKPVDPVDPPNPPVVQPPTITITTVADLVSGKVYGKVLLAGHTTEQQGSDEDEWYFTDGTGTIVLDFSTRIPTPGQAIFAYGSGGRSEVDVVEWAPQ
jgi:uncharacterized protein YdeI (BOF family)